MLNKGITNFINKKRLNEVSENLNTSNVIISLTLEDITKIVNAFTDVNIPIEAVKEEIEIKITDDIGNIRQHDVINSLLLDDDELKRLIWEEWEDEIKSEDPRQMVFKYMKLMRSEFMK